ncbi:MAG: diaminopimelate decarboxylase [Nanoarchaeota archaeon]|nr:diaminopimelate decarboxylase [Nanoarchaeota archaeon]
MMPKNLPFTQLQIEEIIRQYPTPIYIYDEKGIRESARGLQTAFSWVSPAFKNYFAVKATPNPYILEILKKEGNGADCSSLPELMLAKWVGLTEKDIMFTSNDTPAQEFKEARKMNAIINLDDITHIEFLEQHASIPELICFRYNPGASKSGNNIIGNPEEAKYGLTKEQIMDAYKIMVNKGVKRFGLHTMVASNELNPTYFIDTARMLFDLVVQISQTQGIKFEFVNLGGGIGIPYKPDQKRVNLEEISAGVKTEYEEKIVKNELHPLRIVMECGRLITGPHGYLVTTVRHVTSKHKEYVGVDASMANLMRPGIYGTAYHHISVLGKENVNADHTYDVTGSLCENNDKFAVNRQLPKVERGDIIIIHDAGAHGHSMGFQYNGKLRSAELLLKEKGKVELIRRAETVQDYFQTLNFPGRRFRL